MTLRVSGKNLDIGGSLRQHVLEKVEGMVARYFNGTVSGHVVIAREGSGYRSDCTLRLSSGVSLHAEGAAHEPYPCFEHAADKIEARLRRYKQRLKARAGGGEIAALEQGKGTVSDTWSRPRPTRKSPPRASSRWSSPKGRRRSSPCPSLRRSPNSTSPARRWWCRPRHQRTGEHCVSETGRSNGLARSTLTAIGGGNGGRRTSRTDMSLSE